MAEEEQVAERKEAAAPAPPERKRGRMLLIAGAAVVVLGLAGGGAWYAGVIPIGGGTPAEAAKKESVEPEPEVGALLPLDPFIANLADESGKRYLKATMQLEFFSRETPPQITQRLPQVRDLILTLLSSKTFADVRSVEGKARLREEIIDRLNRLAHRDVVKAVYFTEFIVQ